MRWTEKPPRKYEEQDFHWWFAWYPVRFRKMTIWLEWVARRRQSQFVWETYPRERALELRLI